MTEQWKDGPELEQARLDACYRIEREWGVISIWSSWLGFGAIYVGWRPSGAVMLGLSILCQLISWRAMRAVQRLEQQRIARLTYPDGVPEPADYRTKREP